MKCEILGNIRILKTYFKSLFTYKAKFCHHRFDVSVSILGIIDVIFVISILQSNNRNIEFMISEDKPLIIMSNFHTMYFL